MWGLLCAEALSSFWICPTQSRAKSKEKLWPGRSLSNTAPALTGYGIWANCFISLSFRFAITKVHPQKTPVPSWWLHGIQPTQGVLSEMQSPTRVEGTGPHGGDLEQVAAEFCLGFPGGGLGRHSSPAAPPADLREAMCLAPKAILVAFSMARACQCFHSSLPLAQAHRPRLLSLPLLSSGKEEKLKLLWLSHHDPHHQKSHLNHPQLIFYL